MTNPSCSLGREGFALFSCDMEGLLALADAGLPGVGGLALGLDSDGHADVGEVFLQGDDVLVEQADAALAGTAGNGALVVGAAVDADALVAGRFKSQEPVSVGLDVAPAVLEVVFPRRCVLDHRDFEGLSRWGLGGAHVAAPLLVALVLAHAAGVLCDHDGVAPFVAVIDGERLVALGDDDECGAAGFVGQRWQLRLGLGSGKAVGCLYSSALGMRFVDAVRVCCCGNGQQQ